MPFQYDQAGSGNNFNDQLIKPGMIIPFAGNALPSGYLSCDGSAVSQIVYAALFAVIGTTWNTGGEPVGTFRVPDARSRSFMFAGTGPGLSARTLGQVLGEEDHVLTVGELAIHTHVQDAHNHTQNSHNHIQDAHTHTQDAHTHTQNSHNHTQDAHTHTQNSHTHGTTLRSSTDGSNVLYSQLSQTNHQLFGTDYGANITNGTGSSVQSATATNQNTTATNQAATATNQNTTATNQNTTATNQAATATNNATTATNQNTGSDTGHNTIHPVFVCNAIIKY